MDAKLTVTADCLCDIGDELLSKLEVAVIYFHVITDSGDFKDSQEITSENVIEYIAEGHTEVYSKSPSTEEYRAFFERHLTPGGSLIHICSAGFTSHAYEHACQAAEQMENVYVYDSGQVSSGLGVLVIRAAELASRGMSAEAVAAELDKFRSRVSATFIAFNADFLYSSGKVSRLLMLFTSFLHIRPVFKVRSRKMQSVGFVVGKHDFCCRQYVRMVIGRKKYDRNMLFVTYTGFSKKQIDELLLEIKKRGNFGNIYVNKASATVTVNCGPETLGLIYVKR